jgi:PAS domain S-box-containing protein
MPRSVRVSHTENQIRDSSWNPFNIDVLKKTQCALRMKELEIHGIVETIPAMLWSTSPMGEVTHISRRVLEYTGLALGDFFNLGWEKIIHPDDFKDTAKAFFLSIKTGESYSAIHRLRRRDGEYRWHHSSGEPLRDSDDRIIQWYGLSTDIDEQKRAESHLRDLRIKHAKASQLSAVAELAASIAHELNQPLMSILVNAQAAKKWLNACPSGIAEVDRSIENVIRDVRAADETMRHIRALFKQEPVFKKEASMLEMMREAVRLVQEDPDKREIQIDWLFDENLPKIPVDHIPIQEVFINLISNAIEAQQNHGVAPMIKVSAAITDQSEMVVRVIDNGPGVNDLEKIFDAFVTTKERGMGIGLTVSRSIVEAHGGRLWAENGPDGGARFNVALPLTPMNRDEE